MSLAIPVGMDMEFGMGMEDFVSNLLPFLLMSYFVTRIVGFENIGVRIKVKANYKDYFYNLCIKNKVLLK